MRWPDLAVIAVYLAAITWFGARFRRSQHSLKDYFLGGKTVPWWAIALSIVSAETSTLTVIGTPVLSFQGNFGFLQVVFGYLLARIVIAALFLPAYFRGEMFTAYELMRVRFGERVSASSPPEPSCSCARSPKAFVSWRSHWLSRSSSAQARKTSIVVILCLTLFYTYEGGMTAVIWTDVVQMFLYVFGAAVSLVVILHEIPGGWAACRHARRAAGKFQVFDFRFSYCRSLDQYLQLLGRRDRRNLPHHREPWNRAASGPAPARRAR